MGRDKRRKGADPSRDAGGFIALPWAVLDSPAYLGLSHPARSLLLELCRQYVRDNNGRLLASMNYLTKRGWKSFDTIGRAKAELLAAGLIHETVKGHRPNRASWYALTFYSLDRLPGYDHGAAESFERGAYRKNARLTPPDGVERPAIAPPDGVERPPTTPPDGAMEANFCDPPTPPDGDHLDKPSAGQLPTRHNGHRNRPLRVSGAKTRIKL